MTLAARERRALADALHAAGPDGPTLCEGWRTRELAAHLVLRETRADVGLVLAADAVSALRGYADRVMARFTSRPYPDLVQAFREGPPRLSVFVVLDRVANAAEHFVHHEDVRRALPGWQPRPLASDDERTLFGVLRWAAARRFSSAPVGVVLRTPSGLRITARKGMPAVVLCADAGELLLAAFGRQAHARLDVQGEPATVAAFRMWFEN